MNGKIAGICDRCGQNNNNTTITSKFNMERICMTCKDEEKLHVDYKKADEAEIAECLKGNLNYEGIGLPADLIKK